MTAAEGANRRPFSLLLVIIVAIVSNSEGQEDTSSPGVRIIWKKALDSGIEHRRYFDRTEPDVGISSDGTRANPVRLVATAKSVYVFDAQGDIERKISLRKDTIPDEVKALTTATLPDYIKRGGDKREFTREYAMTAPNGEFYIIRTRVSNGYSAGIDRLRAFNVDGSLRFELGAKESASGLDELTYISPNGDYIVIFYSGWGESPFPHLDFYDTRTGALINHIGLDDFVQYDCEPSILGFSEDGANVILRGNKPGERILCDLLFDARGNFIRRIAGALETERAARQARDAMKHKLEPKAVEARLQRGHHTGGIAEFGLLRDRSMGMYSRGDTLYLFELDNRQGGTENEPR